MRPDGFRTPIIVLCLFTACTSAEFRVSDEHFFADGHALGGNYLQYVELSDKAPATEPTMERFGKNCHDAEAAARVRFKAAYPQARDEGRRLSEHFEKNAGCRVRMVFVKG